MTNWEAIESSLPAGQTPLWKTSIDRFMFNITQIERKYCRKSTGMVCNFKKNKISFEFDSEECSFNDDADLIVALKRQSIPETVNGQAVLSTAFVDKSLVSDVKDLTRIKKLNKMFQMSKDVGTSRGGYDVDVEGQTHNSDGNDPMTKNLEPSESHMDEQPAEGSSTVMTKTSPTSSLSSSSSSSSSSDSDATYAGGNRSRLVGRSFGDVKPEPIDNNNHDVDAIHQPTTDSSMKSDLREDGSSDQPSPPSSGQQLPATSASISSSSCSRCSRTCSCSSSEEDTTRSALVDIGKPSAAAAAAVGPTTQSTACSSRDLMLNEELVTPVYVTRHFLSKLDAGPANKPIKTEPADDYSEVAKGRKKKAAPKPVQSTAPAKSKGSRGRPKKESMNRAVLDALVAPPPTATKATAAGKRKKTAPTRLLPNEDVEEKATVTPPSKRPALPLDPVTAKRYKNPSHLWDYMEKLIRSGGSEAEGEIAGPSGTSSAAAGEADKENRTPTTSSLLETPKTSRPAGRRSAGKRTVELPAIVPSGPFMTPASAATTSTGPLAVTPVPTSAGGFVFEVHGRTPLDAVPIGSAENVCSAKRE